MSIAVSTDDTAFLFKILDLICRRVLKHLLILAIQITHWYLYGVFSRHPIVDTLHSYFFSHFTIGLTLPHTIDLMFNSYSCLSIIVFAASYDITCSSLGKQLPLENHSRRLYEWRDGLEAVSLVPPALHREFA